VLNFTAGAFLLMGAIFNIAVWYYAKDLQIFDDVVETDAAKKNSAEDNNLKGNALQLQVKPEKQ